MKREGRPHSAPRPRHDDALSLRLVEDVAARVVFLNEALEAGELGLARDIVRDLEEDLAAQVRRRKLSRCPVCGLNDWPGAIEKHVAVIHPERVAA